MSQVPRRPRVLFAMITVGDGHRSAAVAARDWLERAAPGRLDTQIEEFTRTVGNEALDDWHKRSWRSMLRRPWSAYLAQRAIDTVVPLTLTRAVQRRILADHAERAALWLTRHPFDLIVCTHFFTSTALAIAKRRHGLRTPVVALNPDAFDAHALWAEPDLDAFVVYSQAARADLTKRGVPRDRVRVQDPVLKTPFVAPCAEPNPDRRRLRRELGVPEDAFTVLYGAGGEGIGGQLLATVGHLRTLRAARPATPEIAVLALCGRNQDLLTAAGRHRHGAGVQLLPLGYREDVRALLCAADLFAGKAGPSSVLEALISGRPLLFTGYAAANEYATLQTVVRAGAGRHPRGARALAEEIVRLSTDPEELQRWREGVRQMHVRNGGPELAAWLWTRYLAPPTDVRRDGIT